MYYFNVQSDLFTGKRRYFSFNVIDPTMYANFTRSDRRRITISWGNPRPTDND